MTVPAVDIKGLVKKYKDFEALKGVDLRIEPGEFFGLLGPNGAGKSTLINIMVGLTRRTAGDVRIFGDDVSRDYIKTRLATGVVPQEIITDEFFSVERTLDFISGYFGARANREWKEELLEALDLKDHRKKHMSQLSGGMKRRLLIAKAMVHRPRLLILDEPTAGVDVALRQSLWKFVRRINEEGTTVLLTTHYIEEAEELCGRVAIIDHGNIVAMDHKKNLMGRLKEKTVSFQLSRPIESLSPKLEAAGLALSAGGEAVEYCLTGGNGSFKDMLGLLASEDLPVVDVNIQQADLEDVFLSLTGKPEEGRRP